MRGGAQRRERVLTAALDVFATFGFRKTSMDSVAQAADISRPGLYFLFESKDVLFRETMRHAMDGTMADVHAALDDPTGSLAERLSAALDAWLGRYVGTHLNRGVDALMEQGPQQLGDLYDEYRTLILASLARAIADDGPRSDAATPADVADMLHAAATGWKYRVSSRHEFKNKLDTATRIAVGGQPPSSHQQIH